MLDRPETSARALTLAGTPLSRYFHICAFFDSRDEEYSVLASYYKEGLRSGEKALHIVDPDLRDDHRTRLRRMDIDVDVCERHGQLEITTPADTYLAEGTFDPQKMLVTIDQILAAARENGFLRTRLMGNMGWALANAPGSDRLIDYEARLNEVLARTRQPAICVYDTARLNGSLMLDILRCHPLMLVNGAVHENSFFTPPDVFLAELRCRRRPPLA